MEILMIWALALVLIAATAATVALVVATVSIIKDMWRG